MEALRGSSLILDYRYIGVFCTFFLYSTGCMSIIPGRSLLIFVGVLCHRGYLSFFPASVIATIASIMGANAGYALGRYAVGNIIASRERFMFLSKGRLEKGMAIMREYGLKLIVPAMFVGGFWAFTSLIPGMIRIRYPSFAPINAMGLIAWVYVLMNIGYWGSHTWSDIITDKSYILVVILVSAIALFIVWKTIIKKRSLSRMRKHNFRF